MKRTQTAQSTLIQGPTMGCPVAIARLYMRWDSSADSCPNAKPSTGFRQRRLA